MSETEKRPSLRSRCLVGILTGVVIGTIVWELGRTQRPLFFYLLGVLVIGLVLVMSTATWRHGRRWVLSRGALRFHAWVVVSLLSLVVLFYNEEGWRGKRAWAALQREAAARGESLDLSSVIPPPVSDDENFACAPGVEALLADRGPRPVDSRETMKPAAFYHGTHYRWPRANWLYQEAADLIAWQKFFRRYPAYPASGTNTTAASPPLSRFPNRLSGATNQWDKLIARWLITREVPGLRFPARSQPQTPAADVLLALSQFDANLTVLRKALERPKVRYPLDYERGAFAPDAPAYYFMNLSEAVHVLSLRASAKLSLGQTEASLQDVILAFRLSETLRPDRSFSTRSTSEMLMMCLQPVWEGLTAHRWTQPELAALEKQFASIEPLAGFRHAFRTQTLKTMDLLDQIQAFLEGRPTRTDMAPDDGSAQFVAELMRWTFPTGWLYQDKVWFYRFYERYADPLSDLGSRPLDPHAQAKDWRWLMDPLAVTFFVPRAVEVLQTGGPEALFLHTTLQEATVACALERYRQAERQYPEALQALVPTYLPEVPRDMLDRKGASLKYCRADNEGFVVYSVGLNRVDDGGNSSPPDVDGQGIPSLVPRLDRGDWVWRQSGK